MYSKDDLDFEITFYERFLQERPDNIEALIALADAYTKRGRHREGLKIDQRLKQLKPNDPVVHYNLACSYSLLGNALSCLRALKKSLELGYRDFSFMEKDPDLAFVRNDPRFKELLSKYACRSSK